MRVWFDLRHPERPWQVMEKARADVEAGDVATAVEGLRLFVNEVHWPGLQQLAQLLESDGRLGEALDVWRQLLDKGNRAALRETVAVLTRHNRHNEAEALLRRELLRGPPHNQPWTTVPDALGRLAEHLTSTGRADEARQLLRFGVDPSGRTAEPWEPADLGGSRTE